MSDRYILLIEDNADDELLAMRAIARRNAEVRVEVARDGAEALEALTELDVLARSGRRLPDLVLLDLKLPKVSGLDVLRHLRAAGSMAFLPVVVLSSSSEDRDVLDSYRAGANGYVRKAVDLEAFTGAVGEILRFWLELNESPNRVCR